MVTVSDAQQSAAWRASRRAARRYRESGNNPLYLWESAAIAMAAGIPPPVVVGKYLERVAARLGASVEVKVPRPAALVMAALELDGRGPSAFERRRRFERDRIIASMAETLRQASSLTLNDALEHQGRDPESLARQKRRRRRTSVGDTCP